MVNLHKSKMAAEFQKKSHILVNKSVISVMLSSV